MKHCKYCDRPTRFKISAGVKVYVISISIFWILATFVHNEKAQQIIRETGALSASDAAWATMPEIIDPIVTIVIILLFCLPTLFPKKRCVICGSSEYIEEASGSGVGKLKQDTRNAVSYVSQVIRKNK